MSRLKRLLIGRPLGNDDINREKYGVLWGLPILASDAISSVAYAGQEILLVLVPVIGLAAYGQLINISLVIIGLLAFLTFSYSQTIENYSNGGGAYIVAKDNLGITAGVTAGAALSVDYVMTVAVSISSGVEQITSAFLPLRPYTVHICIATIIFITIVNLRGVRESALIFGIPTYAVILAFLSMLIVGFINQKGGQVDQQISIKAIEPVSVLLLLKAFSNGCTALTGFEAVSNAVPNFKEPSVKHARSVLLLLSLTVLVLFGGTSLLAKAYCVVPGDRAIVVQIAEAVFDRNFMFFYVVATTFIILVMAANTAYSGFPLLVAVMAKEGYVPRQLGMRGDRLSYSNGIIVLSAVAIILITAFRARVSDLIGLYAIGVFISFTLSQAGMFARWLKNRGKHWKVKALINGTGALLTAAAVLVITTTKFSEGAWVVVVLIPALIYFMMKIKNHYTAVAKQLRISTEELKNTNISRDHYRNRVIVPVESINKASLRALRYAKTISDNVTAFNVSIDTESARKLRERYDKLKTGIPLIIKYSPFRKVVEPLLKFIESAEYDYQPGDMITVILPQFAVRTWWQNLLHNNTGIFIERELLRHNHIVIARMPLQLKYDDFVLKTRKNSKLEI